MKSLRYEIDDHVARVTMLGPGKGNAMGPDFWTEMPVLFRELDGLEDIRVVVIKGSGENFTFGLDLKATAPFLMNVLAGDNLAGERTKLRETVLAWQEAFNAIAECRHPVIAAVDGWCIGGGMNLVAACDIRVCTRRAKFSLREPRIAITPDLGALQRLPAIIGEGATRLMAYTAGDYDAAFAERVGLAQVVYDDADAMKAGVAQMCREIAANSPLAVRGSKHVLDFCRDASVHAGLQYVATFNAAFLESKDLQEAVAAFMERRAPNFRGE